MSEFENSLLHFEYVMIQSHPENQEHTVGGVHQHSREEESRQQSSLTLLASSENMYIYWFLKLTRLPSNENLQVTLNNDSLPFIIGRGIMGITDEDTRVSKNQCEIKISNNQCKLFHRGLNPTFLQSLQRFNEIQSKQQNVSLKELLGNQLEKSVGYPISEDIVSFLVPNQDPIQIQLNVTTDRPAQPSVDSENDTSGVNSSSSITTTSTTSTTTSTTTTTSKRLNNENEIENIEEKDIESGSSSHSVKKVKSDETYIKSSIPKDSDNLKGKLSTPTPTSNSAKPKPITSIGNRWSDALLPYCKSPEDHKDSVVYYDDQIVIIRDYYPKAKHHYLVMPRRIIPSINDLKITDIELLEYMNEKSISYIHQTLKCDLSMFMLGFHAIPSMKQLHMHIISKDFDSPSLKKKEHWVSFTTDFFIPYPSLYNNLKFNQKIIIDKEKYLALKSDPIKCPKCSNVFKTLPSVKEHYKSC
ncbi:histidine triad family protein [Heterostelium album PN500]|uniref:Histidine triad family protein n=1 Tax=Heterostelium pallidum (strain ATCC 26659 / Pp 5 / PN500) TaxID=670386 RepID=D3BN22_HETP5|nr:histidine triad family protein [Heterostelium album PN500]EFA77384.1 histidine triad family protein [Heterostelium album PN500]|eukprot:XP_020429513.1 histidine triad family protein [Heterostelium album PN500]